VALEIRRAERSVRDSGVVEEDLRNWRAVSTTSPRSKRVQGLAGRTLLGHGNRWAVDLAAEDTPAFPDRISMYDAGPDGGPIGRPLEEVR
jgi:hypothetical protein